MVVGLNWNGAAGISEEYTEYYRTIYAAIREDEAEDED